MGPADVMVIDDSEDLCMLTCELLRARLAVKTLPLGSLDAMVKARDAALGTRVALLDVNLGAGKPSGVDVYRWLLAEGYTGSVLFFSGHARNHPELAAIVATGVTLLEKPVPAGELVEAIRAALPAMRRAQP